METPQTPAELIRTLRESAGLTQVELAARLGVQQGVISRWERGAVDPAASRLLAVMAACGAKVVAARK